MKYCPNCHAPYWEENRPCSECNYFEPPKGRQALEVQTTLSGQPNPQKVEELSGLHPIDDLFDAPEPSPASHRPNASGLAVNDSMNSGLLDETINENGLAPQETAFSVAPVPQNPSITSLDSFRPTSQMAPSHFKVSDQEEAQNSVSETLAGFPAMQFSEQVARNEAQTISSHSPKEEFIAPPPPRQPNNRPSAPASGSNDENAAQSQVAALQAQLAALQAQLAAVQQGAIAQAQAESAAKARAEAEAKALAEAKAKAEAEEWFATEAKAQAEAELRHHAEEAQKQIETYQRQVEALPSRKPEPFSEAPFRQTPSPMENAGQNANASLQAANHPSPLTMPIESFKEEAPQAASDAVPAVHASNPTAQASSFSNFGAPSAAPEPASASHISSQDRAAITANNKRPQIAQPAHNSGHPSATIDPKALDAIERFKREAFKMERESARGKRAAAVKGVIFALLVLALLAGVAAFFYWRDLNAFKVFSQNDVTLSQKNDTTHLTFKLQATKPGKLKLIDPDLGEKAPILEFKATGLENSVPLSFDLPTSRIQVGPNSFTFKATNAKDPEDQLDLDLDFTVNHQFARGNIEAPAPGEPLNMPISYLAGWKLAEPSDPNAPKLDGGLLTMSSDAFFAKDVLTEEEKRLIPVKLTFVDPQGGQHESNDVVIVDGPKLPLKLTEPPHSGMVGPLSIAGETEPNAEIQIIIDQSPNPIGLRADKNGQFKHNETLAPGGHVIRVRALQNGWQSRNDFFDVFRLTDEELANERALLQGKLDEAARGQTPLHYAQLKRGDNNLKDRLVNIKGKVTQIRRGEGDDPRQKTDLIEIQACRQGCPMWIEQSEETIVSVGMEVIGLASFKAFNAEKDPILYKAIAILPAQ